MLEKLFDLKKHETTVSTEVIAGITTFLAMAYIVFINPNILGTTGMDKGAVIVATCLAAAFGCFIMAFWANWPVGMAPGMGLNAFFAYTVVAGMGWAWQAALGAVFISGCIFILLTITGLRRWIVEAIPSSLQVAIPAGIGLFLALIALKSAGIVTKNDATFVTMGNLHAPQAILAIVGFFIIAFLDFFKIKGAILIGILTITIISMALGYTTFNGLVSAPPSIAPTLLQLDIKAAIGKGIFNVVLVFVLVEIFDATGVLTGLAKRAGLVSGSKGNAGINRALFADSASIFGGSLLGTSSTTAYIESMAGIQAGGRTGLTAFVIGVLFLLALFFSPLIGTVPSYATAPALVYVAGLMLSELSHVEWEDITEAAPAALTALVMPFTYSIANGLAFGFISYTALKLVTGRHRDVHPAAWIIAILFLLRFAWLPEH
ncbi:NCS2 family permease [Paraburkholderia fungorum]|uniref:NCS2 family permease n=1 Tax=Paraburkholderia fungorum TaxID=134537 RepID=UPI00402B1180